MPPTERKGRVHTSTVTVSVLDAEKQASQEISLDDLDIEWYSGTGAGGQHRNKHQNSCRITHIPTGLTVSAQTRSRDSSYLQAFTSLTARIQEASRSEGHANMATIKKKQMGSGMRGDKIRTYRFQEDTVTDHNSGKTATCKEVMRGGIDRLWK